MCEKYTPVVCLQLATSDTMEYHTQVLPIRCSGRKRLEASLREILGCSDLIIEAFFCDQWTIKVP
ncbi:hypothetical protein F4801DRAFT_573343 [Xylaria longipes]|nr:hypothetical protein F4801DRAFT_573343 [Xylaria longipes]